MIDKVVPSLEAAVDGIYDGATILVGGFGYTGVPENLLAALARSGPRALSTVSDDAGLDGWGMSLLIERGLVRSMRLARGPDSPHFQEAVARGEIEATYVPLGTLMEAMRAGGNGIAAFYTPTGVGTVVAEGKETREFDGRAYLLEHAIIGDFSLIAAHKGDRLGNLIYHRSARNLNPVVAMAGRVCIAEVEELVEVGEIDPDQVHTPGIHVHRVVVAPRTKGLPRTIPELRQARS